MIKQHIVSPVLSLFEKGFTQRWKLLPYIDKYAPTLFVGAYKCDLITINSHRGFKLIMFAGEDLKNIKLIKKPYEIVASQVMADTFIKQGINIKPLNIPFKSYSDFKPHKKGDHIYCYQSSDSEANKIKYRYDLLENIIDHFGSKVIVGYHPHTIKEMKKIYKKCFINVQLNPLAGFTTVLEMAHMNRPTVSNYPSKFCIPFTNDIIKVIDKAREYRDVYDDANDFLHHSSDWLTIKYWE